MSKTRSPFEILGVTPADDMATIRMAWRALVKRLHPDRASDKPKATAELAEVNAAFDRLQGHVPKGQEAERARRAAELQERARRAAALRAEARREREAELARKHRETLARAEAKARAAKASLKSEMGTINARAAEGYAQARRVVSNLQK